MLHSTLLVLELTIFKTASKKKTSLLFNITLIKVYYNDGTPSRLLRNRPYVGNPLSPPTPTAPIGEGCIRKKVFLSSFPAMLCPRPCTKPRFKILVARSRTRTEKLLSPRGSPTLSYKLRGLRPDRFQALGNSCLHAVAKDM